MEKQLGWTTIEQSEKLIKAGLNPNTADMSYLGTINADLSLASYVNAKERFKDKKSDFFKVTPCWSLGALINLMQPFYPAIDFEGNDLWNISICAISDLFSDDEGYDIIVKEKSLTEACIKTIIELIQHGEIKNSK